jgi:hypothetical protein
MLAYFMNALEALTRDVMLMLVDQNFMLQLGQTLMKSILVFFCFGLIVRLIALI